MAQPVHTFQLKHLCSLLSSHNIPESGRELRSAQRTMGMTPGSEVGESEAMDDEALSAMLFSSDRNIMVWISFTSENSGSQCM